LKQEIKIEFVPGITAMSGAWNNARLPIAMGDQPLTILMGIQGREELKRHLENSKNVVIMKIGTHLEKVKSVLTETGHLNKAIVIEKATMPEQKIFTLIEYTKSKTPYFSIILVSEEHYE
jgi:precorrin-2/cobalt-factor-2 C20-methyltransferase